MDPTDYNHRKRHLLCGSGHFWNKAYSLSTLTISELWNQSIKMWRTSQNSLMLLKNAEVDNYFSIKSKGIWSCYTTNMVNAGRGQQNFCNVASIGRLYLQNSQKFKNFYSGRVLIFIYLLLYRNMKLTFSRDKEGAVPRWLHENSYEWGIYRTDK